MSDWPVKNYYRQASSWAEDRRSSLERSVRIAWIVACIAVAISTIEALLLLMLFPLKKEVPYTLLVDRQTGYVQALDPLNTETVSPDSAITRSFLVQYVIARESFDIDSLQNDYRKVGLWSTGEAREQYVASMQAGNPASPLATMARRATVHVEVRSVSPLSPKTAMVRFTTTRTDPAGRGQPAQSWVSIITYKYSETKMNVRDRLVNPLGFQVSRYRRDVETLPEEGAPDRGTSLSTRTVVADDEVAQP